MVEGCIRDRMYLALWAYSDQSALHPMFLAEVYRLDRWVDFVADK